MASWHIGKTLEEDLRYLIESGPKEINGDYLVQLSTKLKLPLESLASIVTSRVISLSPDERLVRHLLEVDEAGMKLDLIARGTSEQAPASLEFAKLVVQVLDSAARLAQYLDCIRVNGDQQRAAQTRFDRLRELRTGQSWLSYARTVLNADGTPYLG
jgi:hypothetical protein